MATNNIINANATTPMETVNGGSGVSSPLANGVLIANGASPFSSQVMTDGQLLIGSTGVAPVSASLTAGSGISVTPGAGAITIASTVSPAGTTTEVTGTSQLAVVQNNYIANNAGLVTITLPAAPGGLGDFVRVWGKGAGGWRVDAGSGSQIIQFGNIASAAGGSISSTLQYDCVELRCITAGGSAVWLVVDAVGNLDVV